MTIVEALITSARRYASEKMGYWFDYSCEKSENILPLSKYSPNARIFILGAISGEISLITDKLFPSKEECLSELETIGMYACDDFTEHVKDEIGISAMNDEREKFIAHIRNISDEELSHVLPLPYSRKLDIAGSREVRETLKTALGFRRRLLEPIGE